jgi:hypothetical protein
MGCGASTAAEPTKAEDPPVKPATEPDTEPVTESAGTTAEPAVAESAGTANAEPTPESAQPTPTESEATAGEAVIAKNAAFVFIKPHANVTAVQELVQSKFAEKGISILSEGEIGGADIDANSFIDQHYYAIASKATIMKPAELNVPEDKFKDFFSEEWSTVKEEDRAFNAIDMQAKLGVDSDVFESLWDATNDGKRIKFGGGFYCGCIEQDGAKYYTFNALCASWRSNSRPSACP